MSALCITCGERPRKKGRRQCGPCAYRSEDQDKAQLRRQRGRGQRREYKRAQRQAAGCESMEMIRARAAQKQAEREAKRTQRKASTLASRPWLQYPHHSAAMYRSRYQNDPEFAQRERERAIVFRFTHPEIAAKSDRGRHWQLAASRADGSVTEGVVRNLLHARSCYLCGVELTPANRSIDHRVALILGGNHSAGNLAPCCMPCNRAKAMHERRQAREARAQRDRAHAGKSCVVEEGSARTVPRVPSGATFSRVPATPGFQDVGDA